jgi:COMPASS component SWD3
MQGKALPTPFLGHHNYIYSLQFSPKGNMLVSGSYDEAVFLWDVRSGRVMRSLPAHSDPVSGVDFIRDGTLIASCSSDGLMLVILQIFHCMHRNNVRRT